MTDYPHLEHAPILQAVLDIRVKISEKFDYESFASFRQGLENRFPERRDIGVFSIGFRQEQGHAPESIPMEGQNNGYQFLSPSRAVSCQTTGFTFSRLNGYEDWPTFISEARELWAKYAEIAPVESVTRLAVRYINRIAVPRPGDYEDVFKTVPIVAKSIDKGLASFVMRLVLPQADEIMAIVTLATDHTMASFDVQPVIFDIDVFKAEIEIPVDQQMWEVFDSLRQVKNTIFFESIVEKVWDQFK